MEPQTLSLLCDPRTREPLRLVKRQGQDRLSTSADGAGYEIRDGIGVFLSEVSGSNRKYQEFYDRIALFYDLYITTTAALIRRRSWRAARSELTARLGRIPAGFTVLEVGIGTGLNLELLPRDMAYYGVDISWNMLRRCRRRSGRMGRCVHLFLAEAEALPFRDACFDAVFTVGGFNFFRDKQVAMNELIRVAKSGARVLVVDETEEHVKKAYERTPVARGVFKGESQDALKAPVNLVSGAMRDLRSDSVWKGRFYSVSFVKP